MKNGRLNQNPARHRKTSHQRWFFQVYTGKLSCDTFPDQPRDFSGGVVIVQSLRADIGYAVPRFVGETNLGIVREVYAEAVWGSQTRTLTDQDHGYPGLNTLTNFIADCHTTLLYEKYRRYAEPIFFTFFDQQLEQRHTVRVYSK